MAVYSVNNSNNRFTLRLTLTEGDYSIADNSSPVSYKLELIANTSYNFSQYAIGSSITLGGINVHYQERTTTKQYSIADYGTLLLASGSKTFTHNADGSLELSVAFSIDMKSMDYTPGALSGSGKMVLATIPRYAKFTEHKINGYNETSVTIQWNADVVCDNVQYSLNGGAWQGASFPTYTVSGLTHGTSYTIKTRVRRQDSQLWTESDALSFRTYYYPHCLSSPDFTIGDNLTLDLYNPLGRSITVKGYEKTSKKQIFLGSTTGTKLIGFNDSGSVNNQYAAIPNSQSGQYFVVVSCESASITRDNGNTFKIRGTEKPTINNFDYIDGNNTVVDITCNNKHIVQNQSHLTAQFNDATANYGASRIDKYILQVNGVTKEVTSSGNHNMGTVDSANNVTLTLTAIDSRGLSASKSITVTMLEHINPKATVLLQRLNNYEDETHLTVDGSISSVNGKNTMTIQYRYKLAGGSYGEFEPINDNTEHILSLDKNNAYIFNIVVTDAFGSQYDEEYSLDKGIFPFFIDTEKNSVGVNCFPKGEKTFEVSGYEFLANAMCWHGSADTDANKMFTQGVWIVPEQASSNYPTTNGNGLLIVFAHPSSIRYQLFIFYDGSAWGRMCWYGNWWGWKPLNNA